MIYVFSKDIGILETARALAGCSQGSALVAGASRDCGFCSAEFIRRLVCTLAPGPGDLLLLEADRAGRHLGAALAAALRAPLLTDCIEADRRGTGEGCGAGPITARRVSEDGTTLLEYTLEGDGPWLLVMQAAGEEADAADLPARRISFEGATEPAEDPGGIRVTDRRPAMRRGPEIRRARLIFAGGRGLMNQESFDTLRRAAARYGAAVGSSRPAVDLGWGKPSEQVGQTGSTVRPQVYVAFGISGAIQHMMGMKGSRTIIAVNNDLRSSIFRYCDYGIRADANSILRNLLLLLGPAGADDAGAAEADAAKQTAAKQKEK